MEKVFLSCDWGTTSFRLRWVEKSSVLREILENVGSRALYQQASDLGDVSEKTRAHVYSEFLTQQLRRWNEHTAKLSAPIPLIISGMASSTVGWRELPYVKIPLPLDASKLTFASLDWNKPSFISETYLISGAASDRDIMRGEEVEALGLMANPKLNEWRQDCVLILPGSHSKHLVIRDNSILDLHTFITGELFDVLANHSLLRATVDTKSMTDSFDADPTPFLDGIDWVRANGLAASFFRTRTRGVLDHLPASANALFLSGILIGAELQQITAARRAVLGGGGKLADFYSAALEHLAPDHLAWIQLPPDELERAVVMGQSLFLNHLPKS